MCRSCLLLCRCCRRRRRRHTGTTTAAAAAAEHIKFSTALMSSYDLRRAQQMLLRLISL